MEAVKIVIGEQSSGLLVEEPAKLVDTKGMICPYPSYETAKAFNSLDSGRILEVVTDSKESALESIPIILRRRGAEFVVLEKDQNLWHVLTRKP